MMVKIPSTGKPCTKCGERDGNPLHSGICNGCYSNMALGVPREYSVNRSSQGNDVNWDQIFIAIVIAGFIFALLFSMGSNSGVPDNCYPDEKGFVQCY
jgi:hypothetical protein